MEKEELKKEQEIIVKKIDKIESAKVYDKLSSAFEKCGNGFRSNQNQNISVSGRVKTRQSAAEKLERKNQRASDVYDLIGFMYVVDLPEHYDYAKSQMQDKTRFPHNFEHDFDGSKVENNGYSSFHMGTKVGWIVDIDDEELSEVAVEVQLKTKGMYYAQEATHDTIYKSRGYSEEEKNALQSVMFPMVETIVNMQQYEKYGNQAIDADLIADYKRKMEQEKQRLLGIKLNNKDYIQTHAGAVRGILEEYIVTDYIEKVKMEATFAGKKLNKENIKDLKEKCKNIIAYSRSKGDTLQMSNTKPTGYKYIDEVYEMIGDKSIEDIQKLNEEIMESKSKENFLRKTVDVTQQYVTMEDIGDAERTINPEKMVEKSMEYEG